MVARPEARLRVGDELIAAWTEWFRDRVPSPRCHCRSPGSAQDRIRGKTWRKSSELAKLTGPARHGRLGQRRPQRYPWLEGSPQWAASWCVGDRSDSERARIRCHCEVGVSCLSAEAFSWNGHSPTNRSWLQRDSCCAAARMAGYSVKRNSVQAEWSSSSMVDGDCYCRCRYRCYSARPWEWEHEEIGLTWRRLLWLKK